MLRVYAKSFNSDPWGEPLLETDDIEVAVGAAYDWFSQEGWYSQILDEEDNVIFVDYHFIDDWELMY